MALTIWVIAVSLSLSKCFTSWLEQLHCQHVCVDVQPFLLEWDVETFVEAGLSDIL